MKIRLQLALDQVQLAEALDVVGEVHDLINIVEIGTPLLIREGLSAVAAMKKHFPRLPLLADLKIVDAGKYESRIAFEAGADIVTVLAMAHDVTVQAAVRTAKMQKKSIMVDLISIQDVSRRIAEVQRLGVDYVCIHTASDLGAAGSATLSRLEEAVAAASASAVAVAGGITQSSIGDILFRKPDIVIVGGAVMNKADKRGAVLRLRSAFAKANGGRSV
jgi:3-hexulose-6-phosphate synthase